MADKWMNSLMNISLQSTQNKTEQKIPSAPFLLNLPDNDSGNCKQNF